MQTDSPTSTPNEVEVGWLLLGRFDDVDREAAQRARDRTLQTLRSTLPAFDWRMPMVERRDLPQDERWQPSDFIEHGVDERDASHFDFVLVLTPVDLIAHSDRPYSVGIASRAAGIGVLSTARLDPLARGREANDAERKSAIASRLWALALHLLGDLVGAPHEVVSGSAMMPIDSVDALDEVDGYTPATAQSLEPLLSRVADLRLEEVGSPPKRWRFFAKASWINAPDILRATWRARPWLLPFRLGRLSAAALSALVVLLVTAEVWEVSQPVSIGANIAFGLACLGGAVAHALRRQGLFMSRTNARITEQIVIAEVSVVLIVATGLLATYALLFAVAMAMGALLFPASVVTEWSKSGAPSAVQALRTAGVVSSIGLVVGALGASFESHRYVRHVTYVDEEIG